MAMKTFQALEGRLGNFQSLIQRGKSDRVISLKHDLTSKAVNALLNHECAAIHVSQFVPKNACVEYSEQIKLKHDELRNWKVCTLLF